MATTHLPPVEQVDDDADAHPSRAKLYVGIALFLAVLTAVEVATYYVPDVFGGKESPILIATLMILMVVKFWTVAWFFMHLKFDKRLLTVAFYSGLVLAVLVYLAILAAFRFFGSPPSHMLK